MKASVFKNGGDDQQVGEDDHEADRHAQSDDHIVAVAPVVADVLAALLVEELDGLVQVASLSVVGVCIHV